jgi:hypothetical protein
MKTTLTKSTNHDLYDVAKTLHVIENDKTLDEIFRDDSVTMTYAMLQSLAAKNMLKPETSDRIREVYDRLILKNKTLLKKYNSVVAEPSEPKLPKWYGKQRILADIAANKETTELDRAMLALNRMKNIYSRLNARVIKDKHNEKNILTRADYREIIAITRTLENKMADILNKK